MSSVLDPTPPIARTTTLWRRPEMRRLLIIALLAEIGYAVLNLSTMPIYLQYVRGYQAGMIGIIIGAFLLSEAVFKGPMGGLADRFGRKRLIVIGPAISVVTSILTMLIPIHSGPWETIALIGLRVLDGIGASMLWPAAFALAGESVGENQKQEAMSMLNLCYLVGIALALPIGGIVNDTIGPYLLNFTGVSSASLYLAAFLFLACSLTSLAVLPSGKELRANYRTKKEIKKDSGEDLANFLESSKKIPSYLLLGAITFMGIGFPLTIVKSFALHEFGLSETRFGLIALPAAIAMAVLSVPVGRLGEKIGRSRAVHLGIFLCAVGMCLIASGAVVPIMRSSLIFALGGIPVGLGFLLTIPAWYASVSEIDKERTASNIGAVMTAQGLGAIVGSLIGSQLYERLAGVTSIGGIYFGESFARYSPFVGCAVCVTVGWLISLRVLHRPTNSER